MRAAGEAGVLTVGSLEVDPAAYSARFDGRRLDLSSSQVELLALLIQNRHRVVAREQIAKALGLRHTRSVDVLLTVIRREIGRNFVRNVRRRGWILDDSSLG